MMKLVEGLLEFTFADSCVAAKYDNWSFYRNQFQNTCAGAKAVDMVCIANKTCWLIEIKDYREHQRTKPQDLGEEVAIKVRDTLAGLLAAKMNANDAYEKLVAKKSLQAKAIKVVLHLEQPSTHSRLFPKQIDPASLKQSLKRQLRAIDAHPQIVGQHSLSASMDWTVTG